MNYYYCPYCNTSPQAYKVDKETILTCQNCGESLAIVSTLTIRKLCSFILIIAFTSPLIIMFIHLIKYNQKEKNNDLLLVNFAQAQAYNNVYYRKNI